MPSSFSRFLSEEELEQVRDLYLESLKALEAAEAEETAQAGQAEQADEVPAGRAAAPDGTVPPAPASG